METSPVASARRKVRELKPPTSRVDRQSVLGDDFLEGPNVPLANVERAQFVENLRAARHFDDPTKAAAA